MDIEQFKKEVMAIDWNNYNGSYFNPDRVPSALISLALVEQESKERTYHMEGVEPPVLLLNGKINSDVLFAIGNDHSGSYHSAVQGALPFIIQVSLFGNTEVARNCAIETLIDLYYFGPEDGSEKLEKFVKETIKKTISENKDNFIKFSNDHIRNKSLIEDLLEIIKER